MSWFLIYSLWQWSIRLAMVPVILRRRFPPAVAAAWLGMIFFIPDVGLVVYLLIGGIRLGKLRVHQYRAVIASLRNDPRFAVLRQPAFQPHINPEQASLVRQAEAIGGMPVVGGNHVEFLGDGRAMIERLAADIDSARDHVHLLFYIFDPDDMGKLVADALVRAASRSVKCRLIADAAGSRLLFTHAGRHMLKSLRAAGVDVHPALPAHIFRRRFSRLDLRNHRKIAVVDGSIGYTGSQNITDPGYSRRAGAWIDLQGRFTGPIVRQLQMVFLEDWAYETDEELQGPDILPPPDPQPAGNMAAQAVPTGPGADSENFRRVLLAAVTLARSRIVISSPYVVLDEPTLVALSMAAQRGVDVNIILPERSDHFLASAAAKAYFDELLGDGVKIHIYKAGMLHSKTMTADDDFALLGSANLDVRSFLLNFEISVLMYGPQISRQLLAVQTRYMTQSQSLDAKAWAARPAWRRYVESAAALLSPLL